MNARTTAVIPAKNEEETVGTVVGQLVATGLFEEVIVVDNSSHDATATVAANAGARVVKCEREGLGAAITVGVKNSLTDRIFRTDADITSWDLNRVMKVVITPGDLVRGVFTSPYDSFPVTRLVAENACSLLLPDIELPRRFSGGTDVGR